MRASWYHSQTLQQTLPTPQWMLNRIFAYEKSISPWKRRWKAFDRLAQSSARNHDSFLEAQRHVHSPDKSDKRRLHRYNRSDQTDVILLLSRRDDDLTFSKFHPLRVVLHWNEYRHVRTMYPPLRETRCLWDYVRVFWRVRFANRSRDEPSCHCLSR